MRGCLPTAPVCLAVPAVALVVVFAPTPVRGQDPDAILRRADQALAGLTTLRAEFTQEVTNPLLERTTTGRGRILYRSPDRFRIAYADPAGDLIVGDGVYVWIYLPSAQPGQVVRQDAAASGVRNPLTYIRDVRGRYDARAAGVETVAGRSAEHLVLAPRAGAGEEFQRIEAWVDRSTGLVRRLRTRTPDGVVTTYTFTTLDRDVELGDGPFRFTPPRGIEVYDS